MISNNHPPTQKKNMSSSTLQNNPKTKQKKTSKQKHQPPNHHIRFIPFFPGLPKVVKQKDAFWKELSHGPVNITHYGSPMGRRHTPPGNESHIPPNGKFGKSSTQNAIFGGYVIVPWRVLCTLHFWFLMVRYGTWALIENIRINTYLYLPHAVTFSYPSWRSLNHWKGSLNHPKKVTKNCQVGGGFKNLCYFILFSPLLKEMIQIDSYSLDGLQPPPLEIQSPSENGFMEHILNTMRFGGDWTPPIILWQYDCMLMDVFLGKTWPTKTNWGDRYTLPYCGLHKKNVWRNHTDELANLVNHSPLNEAHTLENISALTTWVKVDKVPESECSTDDMMIGFRRLIQYLALEIPTIYLPWN